MTDSVIVIGAGIAGLSTGCYAQMNGYSTRILEMHKKPGGLCTAWHREDYTIDLCIQWLIGSHPKSQFHALWREVGLVQGREFLDLEEFMRFEGADGRTVILYRNLDRLERHLLELSPDDAALIKDLLGSARKLAGKELPLSTPAGPLGRLALVPRLLPLLGPMRKWGSRTVAQVCERFRDPLLKEAFGTVWLPETSAFTIVGTLAWFHAGDGGYPVGGSMPMMRAVEKRFTDLGGRIEYRSRVAAILVENDRAVGVRFDDGREERADVVISAADGHATIFDLLGGRYVDQRIREIYEKVPFPPLVFVGLGVARDFAGEPRPASGAFLQLREPARVGPTRIGSIQYRIHHFDPTLAPAGKTVITSITPTDYEHWKNLAADRPRYEAEKKAAADLLIARLDERYPGLAGQVEVVDVSTPVTFERYTGNWRGSYEGWLPRPENFGTTFPKTLPGLRNFYMSGQWVAPSGGLPIGVMTGREVIQMLCRHDRRRFRTAT